MLNQTFPPRKFDNVHSTECPISLSQNKALSCNSVLTKYIRLLKPNFGVATSKVIDTSYHLIPNATNR